MIDTLLIIPVSLAYNWLKPSITCSPNYPKCHVLNAEGQEVMSDLDVTLKIPFNPSLEGHTIVVITNSVEELGDTIEECRCMAEDITKLVVMPYHCKWTADWESISWTHDLTLEGVYEISTHLTYSANATG